MTLRTGASAAVRCLGDDSDQSVPVTQIRAVYFPTRWPPRPHLIYLCPGCNDAHRVRADPDLLDALRAAGAASDWPTIPDHP